MTTLRALVIAAALPALVEAQASSQGRLVGRVIDEAAKHGINEVHVSIHALGRGTYTDSTGAFRLDGIPEGLHSVVARRIGYEAVTVSIVSDGAGTIERTIGLTRVAILDTISVRETPWLREFDENRRLGLGKFLTPEDIEKLQGISIGNRLSELPSAGIVRGQSNRAFILTSRARMGSLNVWCPTGAEGEDSRGAPCGCYAQVYVDGMLMNPPVTRTDRGMVMRVTPAFNVNSILTMSIFAVEWYAGPSQAPTRYHRAGSDCGVLVIHTKRGK